MLHNATCGVPICKRYASIRKNLQPHYHRILQQQESDNVNPNEHSELPRLINLGRDGIVFSFNWTRWPFVEVGDYSLRNQLEPNLVSDLQGWCDFMLANFDERDGFSSSQAKERATHQYENLCRRLEANKIAFSTDNWWS